MSLPALDSALAAAAAPHRATPPRRAEAAHALVALGAGTFIGLYLASPWMPALDDWLVATGPVGLPSLAHPLGTDPAGRDLLAALALAQSGFVPMALCAWLVCLGLGALLGISAAVAPTIIGRLINWSCVTLASFPRLPFILLVATIFDASLTTAALALGVTFLPDVVGEVQIRVTALRRSAFFIAGRAHGIGWPRLIGHHILRLHLAPVLARHAAHVFAFVVIMEASLSYLARLGRYPIIGEDGNRLRFGALLVDAKSHLDPTLTDLGTWWPLLVEAGFLALLLSCALVLADRLGRRVEG